MEQAFVDRRKHERYVVKDDAIALFNKKIGRIVNISEGGMAVNFLSHDKPFSERGATTIFCRMKALLIEDLQMKVVRTTHKPFSPNSRVKIRTIGVEFDYSMESEHEKIMRYITGMA